MLNALAVLLLCQLAGEITSQIFVIPVPGPVIGMVLLLIIIRLVPEIDGTLRETCNVILRNLSLLFVPAGVGVMLHVSRLTEEWPAILVSLLLGTVLTLVVTALTIRFAMRLFRPHPEERR